MATFSERLVLLRKQQGQSQLAVAKELQIALRTNLATIYAIDKIPAQIATLPQGEVGADNFRQFFASYTASASFVVEDASLADDKQLNEAGIYVVGKNENKTYASFALPPNNVFVVEFTQNPNNFNVAIKGPSPQLFPIIESSARAMFSQK